MRHRHFAWAAAGIALLAAVSVSAENWPGFRGPRGDGTSREANVPTKWGPAENIAWKSVIPGVGHASPVVWGERIYLVSCLEESEERILLALDRRSGKQVWRKTVLKSPLEGIHKLNSRASSTPLTDGERVYVSFLDQDRMFVAAYGANGQKLWEARPGPFSSKHGYCSSPILWKETIIVNGDHDGDGFLVALDRRSGRQVWKTERPNKTRSYCTPLIRTVNGRPQLMMTGSMCVASYDPDTGRQQWIMDGPTEQFVAAPVYNGRLLFITAGYPEKHILAIRPGLSGVVGEEAIAWRTRRGCSYVPSPILHGEFLLIVADGGFASCFQADTGEMHWSERLGGGHSASLVSAGEHVYFLSDRGVTTVVRPGKTFTQVAVNELGEDSFASPVISQGQVFIRGVRHLFAIGKQPRG